MYTLAQIVPKTKIKHFVIFFFLLIICINFMHIIEANTHIVNNELFLLNPDIGLNGCLAQYKDYTFRLKMPSFINSTNLKYVTMMFNNDRTINNSAVVQYYFDDLIENRVYDETKNQNNGTLFGGEWVDGTFGKAIKFDGRNDYINIPHSSSLSLNESFTIEAWIRPKTNYSSDYQYVINKGWDNAKNYQILIDKGTGNIRFIIIDSNGIRAQIYGALPVIDGNWHHITAIRDKDAGVLRFIIDGIESSPIHDSTNDEVSNNDDVFIGTNPIGGQKFNGLIDELKIINRVKTVKEIKSENNRIILKWIQDTDTFSEIHDPNNYITIISTHANSMYLDNVWNLDFKIIFDWDYPSKTLTDVRIFGVTDSNLTFSDNYSDIFYVLRHLVVHSTLRNNTRVNVGEPVIINGYVYYEGTTISPPDGDYNVNVNSTIYDHALVNGTFSILIPAENRIKKSIYFINCDYSASNVRGFFIWDRIQIVSITVSNDVPELNEYFWVDVEVCYEYDGVFLSNGDVYVNNTSTTNYEGHWSIYLTASQFGQLFYHVNKVIDNQYGLTEIKYDASDPTVNVMLTKIGNNTVSIPSNWTIQKNSTVNVQIKNIDSYDYEDIIISFAWINADGVTGKYFFYNYPAVPAGTEKTASFDISSPLTTGTNTLHVYGWYNGSRNQLNILFHTQQTINVEKKPGVSLEIIIVLVLVAVVFCIVLLRSIFASAKKVRSKGAQKTEDTGVVTI